MESHWNIKAGSQVVQFMFLKEHTGCCVEIRLERSKNGNGRTSVGAIAMAHTGDDIDLDQGGNTNDTKELMQDIFGGEVTACAELAHDGKGRLKDNSQVTGLNERLDGGMA